VAYQRPAEFALPGNELPFKPKSAEEVPNNNSSQEHAEHAEDPLGPSSAQFPSTVEQKYALPDSVMTAGDIQFLPMAAKRDDVVEKMKGGCAGSCLSCHRFLSSLDNTL